MRKIDLGQPPSFFYSPRWSPDSKKIAYADKRMNLWVVDLDKPVPEKIDSDIYDTPFHYLDPAWSADSQWIAYTKQLRNYLRAAFVYSLAEKKSRQVTDGRSDAFSPRFDRSGKYLFFVASTSAGLSQGWLDMTSMARSVTSSVYAAVLRADVPSPVAPESDEEGADDKAKDEKAKAEEAKKAGEKAADKPADKKDGEKKAEDKKPEPVKIDFAGIDQRIVALPIERANYAALETGAEGVLFLVTNPVVITDEDYAELDDAAAAERVPLRPQDAQDGEAPREDRRRQPRVRRDPHVPALRRRHEDVVVAGQEVVRGRQREGARRRRGRAQGRDRGPRRSACGVAPDVPRGLAAGARLPLRPELPRPGPQGGGARLRAVRRGDRQPRGPRTSSSAR